MSLTSFNAYNNICNKNSLLHIFNLIYIGRRINEQITKKLLELKSPLIAIENRFLLEANAYYCQSCNS